MCANLSILYGRWLLVNHKEVMNGRSSCAHTLLAHGRIGMKHNVFR